ncbi:MAG: hypothetical protein IKN49_00725 [Elusimicrobiaceae bacterium]|nr:hypothetical protein [Elusimicrobiaceae bacterium]
MINTVGILLEPNTEYQSKIPDSLSVVQNLKYLRQQQDYFPYTEVLSDDKLKIEFCPAKLLYGNNLFEITPDDILCVLVRLKDALWKAQIITCPAILLYAHTYRLDYAKECYVPYSSQTLYPYLQDIHRGGHYKQAFTFYPDEGHMSASSLKLRKIAFYNKTAEILQDKHAPQDLKDILKNLPGTFYRFECSLKTAKEIRRELAVCGISIKSCCLNELIAHNIIFSVLQKNLTQTMQHWHIPDKPKAIDKVHVWLDQYKHDNTRSLLTDMMYVLACVYGGVESVRKIIEQHFDKRHARDFMRRFETLQLEDVNYLAEFKELFMKEVKALSPISKTYLDGLTRKEIVNEDNTCLFAPVLLAIIELLISTPLG